MRISDWSSDVCSSDLVEAQVEASLSSEAEASNATTTEAEEQPRRRRRRRRAESGRTGILARLRNYFLAGVLVTAPIAITAWIAWEFVAFVDGSVKPYIPARWNPESYLPFSVPGFGLLVWVLGLLMFGFLTAAWTGPTLVVPGVRSRGRVPRAGHRKAACWEKG